MKARTATTIDAARSRSPLTTGFAKRTKLREGEYHRDFLKLDRTALKRVRSPEALAVTQAMPLIYVALADAPSEHMESDRVLYFRGSVTDDGERLTAIRQIAAYVGVSVGTLLKALRWMDAEGIIGYDPYKNGAGIRIFINYATASLGERGGRGQKILPARHTPIQAAHTPDFVTPFKDSFAVQDNSRNQIRACENGANTPPGERAERTRTRAAGDGCPVPKPSPDESHTKPRDGAHTTAVAPAANGMTPEMLLLSARKLAAEMAHAAAEQTAQAARQEIARQQEETRRWLETSVMPKVARVAQNEAYKVHRHHEMRRETVARTRAALNVGGTSAPLAPPTRAQQVSIDEAVSMCLIAAEFDGVAGVDRTLAALCENNELTRADADRVLARAMGSLSGGA